MKYLKVWVGDEVHQLIQKVADNDQRSVQHVLKKAIEGVFRSAKKIQRDKKPGTEIIAEV